MSDPSEHCRPSNPTDRFATFAQAQPSFLPPKGDLENVSQQPPAGLPAKPVAAAGGSGSNATQDAIAAARAKIQAKLAAFNRPGAAAASPTPEPAVKKDESPAPPAASSSKDATNAAIAEARKRIEAMKAKAARSANPYLATGKPGASMPSAPVAGSSSASGSGSGPGSSGIHPLLAQNDTTLQSRSSKDRYKPMAPKFATLRANVRQNVPAPAPRRPAATQADASSGATIVNGVARTKGGVNPYYDPSITTEYAPKERNTGKQLKFNQKGKFTRLAEQMRQEQKLEALKARIAEASKKAGLEGEIESGALIKRPPPPDVEWWDSAYLPTKSYNDVPSEEELKDLYGDPQESVLKRIDTTSISMLIQHPIPIPAPGDKLQQAPKALFLTKKEQKKLRRNRRAAEHKDQQDRIRMGLAPPPPDKGKRPF